ncbi:MAG TPA: GGDEF domain-containing protein [Candidatus Elarobacter sp.]|jgi:diguanylate cyclase (GGDEF)-like protein
MRRTAAVLVLAAALLPPAWCRAAEPQAPASWAGAPIPGEAPPASLLRPSVLRATFRAPRIGTALYVGTPWYVRDLSVTLIGPGARHERIAAAPDLPGHMLGLRLPSDAWQADRIELEATTVSTAAPPYLLPAEQLAAIAWRTWWYATLFGFFAALALAGIALSAALRSRTSVAFTLTMGAQAGLMLPWLGLMRPAPEISQPLHAALQWAVYAALASFVLAFLRSVRVPRWAPIAVFALVIANGIAVAGGDVLQDMWFVPDIATQALVVALDLALVVLAVVAVRAGVRGARLLLAGTLTGALTFAAGAFPIFPDAFARAAPLPGAAIEALLLALALGAHLTRRETERPRLAAPGEHVDGLTELANRTAADHRLAVAWDAAAHAQSPLAALLVDADHFRRYNEEYGHVAGDDALRRIANALARAAARQEDCVARYDGDAFVLLLPGTDLSGAQRVAQTALSAIARLDMPHGGAPSKRLSVSIGIASLVPAADLKSTELLRRASTALYIAKTMGRNRAVADEPIAVSSAPG